MGRYDGESKLREFLAGAEKYQRPRRLYWDWRTFSSGIPRTDLYNVPALGALHEAYHAALFGIGYEEHFQQEAEVRIVSPGSFPDFQLRIGGVVRDFEVTHATEPKLGRMHRGDLRAGPPKFSPEPPEEPTFDASELVRVVRKKVDMHYGPGVHLLTYMSYGASGVTPSLLRTALGSVVGDAFDSVWVLTASLPPSIACVKPWPELADTEGWMRVPVPITGPE